MEHFQHFLIPCTLAAGEVMTEVPPLLVTDMSLTADIQKYNGYFYFIIMEINLAEFPFVLLLCEVINEGL